VRNNSLLIRPYNPELRTSPFRRLKVADCGDVDTNPMDIIDTYARVEAAVGRIIAAGALPACVGGDHSLTLPILRAVAKARGPMALVHFDSHQDMWEEYFGNRYFHGTPFRRAHEEGLYDGKATVQFGIRGPVYDEDDFAFGEQHGVTVVRASAIHRDGTLSYETAIEFDRPQSIDGDEAEPPKPRTPARSKAESREDDVYVIDTSNDW